MENLIIIGISGFIQIVMLIQIMRMEKRLLQRIEMLEVQKTEVQNTFEKQHVINERVSEKEESTMEEKEALLNEVLSEVFS